ncbi:MAG: GntR family transcriptional regulator [Hyphomicrobiaceae bacterium]
MAVKKDMEAMGEPGESAREGSGTLAAAVMSLSDQIAAALAAAISRGEYRPGERIHEQAVSTRFGVSRGPIREALRILDKQGLVSILPRRGARVTDPSVDEVNHIFEIRAVLLGLAARTVAERREADSIAELRERVKALRGAVTAAGNPDVYLLQVQQLNLYMCEASGNARLEAMVRSLFHQTLRYARLGLSTEARRKRSIANWRRVVECIAEGDAEGAEVHAKALVTASRDMAVKLLTEGAMAD